RIRPSNYPPGNVHARQIVTRAGQAERLASQSDPEALESYRAFANEFSGVRNVQYAFGRFLLSVNREQDAIDAFKREVDNSPSHFAARLAVAELSLKLHVPGGLQY